MLWVLRAVAALCRLHLDASRGAEGREVLAPVYESFTEGLDAPDLREARELLTGAL